MDCYCWTDGPWLVQRAEAGRCHSGKANNRGARDFTSAVQRYGSSTSQYQEPRRIVDGGQKQAMSYIRTIREFLRLNKRTDDPLTVLIRTESEKLKAALHDNARSAEDLADALFKSNERKCARGKQREY